MNIFKENVYVAKDGRTKSLPATLVGLSPMRADAAESEPVGVVGDEETEISEAPDRPEGEP